MIADITKDQFWDVLSESEPVIIANKYFHGKMYCWYYQDDQLHRENDLPAQIWYNEDGTTKRELFFK